MNEKRIKALNDFIEQDPEEPFNYYALAMEYISEQPDKALDILKLLMDKFPDYLPTYYQAGQVLHEAEAYEAAKEILEKGIALAKRQNDTKTLNELQASLQNVIFEMD